MIDIHDNDIQLIENKILMKYNDSRCDYSNFKYLLELRKEMINKRVLAHQEDFLQDITAFNDALTEALKQMYDKAHRIWDSIKDNDVYGNEKELTAKCYLSNDYPELHPIKCEKYEELWAALCDSSWNPLYNDGVALLPLRLPSNIDDSFDIFVGMDCKSNWNEGLDAELTKDLHLTSAFHNVFDHMNFAITDFIYIRKFEIEINIESNS